MYVVRRAFRNFNQMILPGSTVEPGSVKWFKTRLKDKYIVEVNAHNFDTWRAYFLEKYHVDIKPVEQAEYKGVAHKKEEAVPAQPKQAEQKQPTKKTVTVAI